MPSLNLARIGSPVALGSIAFAVAAVACTGGWSDGDLSEGTRCNPYSSHNECSSGLACTVSAWQVANQSGTSYLGTPNLALGAGAGTDNAGNFLVLPFCAENYCCPVDSNGALTTSNNANCQPGCNGGAAFICSSVGDMSAPYVGVCDFVDSGVIPPDTGPAPDAGGGD